MSKVCSSGSTCFWIRENLHSKSISAVLRGLAHLGQVMCGKRQCLLVYQFHLKDEIFIVYSDPQFRKLLWTNISKQGKWHLTQHMACSVTFTQSTLVSFRFPQFFRWYYQVLTFPFLSRFYVHLIWIQVDRANWVSTEHFQQQETAAYSSLSDSSPSRSVWASKQAACATNICAHIYLINLCLMLLVPRQDTVQEVRTEQLLKSVGERRKYCWVSVSNSDWVKTST